MKLGKLAKLIKHELGVELQKTGSSLQEFERDLQRLNTGDGALKVAAELNLMQDFITRPMSGLVQGLPGLAFNASAGAGAAAGLTFDEMENGVIELNQALDREREKVTMLKKLTQNLRKEHGLE